MGMHTEDQLIPLSALQHYLYCPRQCALIHVEQLWTENRFTAEGRVLHNQAHEGPSESRPGLRIARGLPVRSLKLGVSGQCDVVEFSGIQPGARISPDRLPENVVLTPIEYKRGKPKAHRADEVQVCAQALCLEQMFGREPGSIQTGLIFYGKRKRRTEVECNSELRLLTEKIAGEVHAMMDSGETPKAEYQPELCNACSLLRLCEPKSMRLARGTDAWFHRHLHTEKAEA